MKDLPLKNMSYTDYNIGVSCTDTPFRMDGKWVYFQST